MLSAPTDLEVPFHCNRLLEKRRSQSHTVRGNDVRDLGIEH
jgi:hypothetical protein